MSAEPKPRRSVSAVASRRRGLRSRTRVRGDGEDLATAAHPLDVFYAAAGLPLPRLQAVDGRTVAQPYRRLLVHTRDMTPTLESFHGGAIDLEVLQRRLHGSEYFRQVILRLSGTGRAVEFGANRVFLDAYPARVRQAILAEREPLGHLLRDFEVTHTCRPNAFFRVLADPLIAAALGILPGQVLFGRHNRLFDPGGRVLSEVVEILAPEPPGDGRTGRRRPAGSQSERRSE